MAKSDRPVEVTVANAATPEVVEAFGRLLPQLSSSAPPLTLQALAEIIAAPHNTVLLARDPSAGDRIIGTLTLVIFRIPTAVRAWIEDVVVDTTARGRGVGEALTVAAVNLARQRGAKTVDLTSRRSREAAHRLYEKAGFHVRDTSVYRYGPKPAS
ncbi:MAG TPA: GNAT family N-acetyltransferase [Candidatus Binatia bacterium]|nr:GNAT family N-acetyltransferase [Candidatus Binatia bacterium]